MTLAFDTSNPRVPEAISMVPVKNIYSDPETFQFRTGGNAAGEVASHTMVHRPGNEPIKPLWLYEGEDGRLSVIDGHHRLAYAKRENLEALPARILSFRDGVTPTDAMVFGAYLNLDQEFAGGAQKTEHEVLDAARVFHRVHNGEAKEVAPPPLPVRQPGQLQDAYVAGALLDPAFGYVQDGAVTVGAAARTAGALETPTMQVAVMEIVRCLPKQMQQSI